MIVRILGDGQFDVSEADHTDFLHFHFSLPFSFAQPQKHTRHPRCSLTAKGVLLLVVERGTFSKPCASA